MDQRGGDDFRRGARCVRAHALHQHGCLHNPQRDRGNAPSCRGTAMKCVWISILFLALTSPAATVRVTGSITRAMAEASAGDTILIAGPANFNEHVVIEKPLQLIGTNSPVIDADGFGTPLVIRAAGVVVSGLTLRGGGRDLGKTDSGVLIDAPRARVQSCRVEGGAFGIYLHGINGCAVVDNTILGDTNLPPAQRGN